ncbi:MAG: hypothetical protein J7484_08625 [Microbacterium sp.]|nr:hypothetical protein [Microbacterium sp.]
MTASARPVRIGAVIGAAMAAAAIALSGCSAASPPSDSSTSAPTPTTSAEAVVTRSGQEVTGTGTQQGVAFSVPDGGFLSFTLDVACTGGTAYAIGVGEASSPLTVQKGVCDGTRSFAWPIYAAGKSPSMTFIPDAGGVAWSVSPRFSTARFLADPVIDEECTTFATVYSTVFNADHGYADYGKVTEAEWNEQVEGAADTLATLASSSTTPLAEPFAALLPILRSPQRPLGQLSASMHSQMTTIGDICGANQTELTFEGTYGG